MSQRTREIRMKVSEEEYEIISANAEKLGMQVAPYVRQAAINPTFIQRNYKAVSEHTKTLAEIRTAINRVAFTIDATNNYLPKDIETIVNLMTEALETENQLLKLIREKT